jgi:hypothetical protein
LAASFISPSPSARARPGSGWPRSDLAHAFCPKRPPSTSSSQQQPPRFPGSSPSWPISKTSRTATRGCSPIALTLQSVCLKVLWRLSRTSGGCSHERVDPRRIWPTCRPRPFAGLDCAKLEARQKRPCGMTPATIIKQAAPSQSGYSGQTERRVSRRTR